MTQPNLYDPQALAAAEAAAHRAMADVFEMGDFFTERPGPRGAVVSAAAGAGKSYFVAQVVGEARKRRLRVAVAAPTNDQAFGLVAQVARLSSGQPTCFVPAQGVSLPPAVARLPGVRCVEAAAADREQVIMATLAKLGDAFGRASLGSRDLLVIDEAYQADGPAAYFAAGGLAAVHLLVGDGGQISPFSTIDDPYRWRGLPEDPLQTAVGVLLRNHPHTPVHGMPVTRRLDGRAVRVARLFYPDLPFAPAVLPGVRQLALGPSAGTGFDRALDVAAREGWAHLELPLSVSLQADPEVARLIADLLVHLFEREPTVRCERRQEPGELRQHQVAVGVSHHDQRDRVRAALAACGLGGVFVDTANRLQGLEFEVVVAWHPLSGLPEADAFHVDPGRLCVLLTRHRQACIVVGRAGDRDLLDGHPPATPAYLGWTPDPLLDGWEIHRQVFAELAAWKVPVPGGGGTP